MCSLLSLFKLFLHIYFNVATIIGELKMNIYFSRNSIDTVLFIRFSRNIDIKVY